MKRFVRPRQIEALIVTAVFLASAWWGATYWNRSLKEGREPQFYQLYFEPAVMIACHHGFVISHPQPKPLESFLTRRVNTFSCDQVASGVDLSRQYLYQGAWRYMMYAVGITWRFTGVSWSRLGPLFGILFGLTIAAAYGIFRLGMGRWVALAGAFALSVSTLHLSSLPHLRDYSKAPFTLGLVLILGLLVASRVRRVMVVALSAAYGIVLGIGYGFRTDLLIDIPPIFVVLFFFLEGELRRHVVTKLTGAAAFVLAFLVTAWPILSFVNEKGGGQWHVVLLGLSEPFDAAALQIVPAPYALGDFYQDEYVEKTTKAYLVRAHPGSADVTFGTHEYDIATRAYLAEILSRFPGDLLTRAYASLFHMTELPFVWYGPPIEGFARWLYRPRLRVLAALIGAGPFLVAAAVVAVSAYDLRMALFLVFFLVYFGGYPAVQFGTRHFFHFEFITWWAMGALVQGSIRRPPGPPSLRRVGALMAVAIPTLLVLLVGLRFYQGRQTRRLFGDYVAAAKTPIALGTPDASGLFKLQGPSAPSDVRFLEVDLNRWACGDRAQVTFRYDRKQQVNDYSHVMTIDPSGTREPTRVFSPVYAPAFQGIELPDARPGCLAGASWVDPDHDPLLLSVTLVPGWERGVLYQRLPFEVRTHR
jgi:hypothetical protein